MQKEKFPQSVGDLSPEMSFQVFRKLIKGDTGWSTRGMPFNAASGTIAHAAAGVFGLIGWALAVAVAAEFWGVVVGPTNPEYYTGDLASWRWGAACIFVICFIGGKPRARRPLDERTAPARCSTQPPHSACRLAPKARPRVLTCADLC